MDEPAELVPGSLLLRCDRGMCEVFSHARPEPSLRCPVRWVAVAVAFDKRGRGTPKPERYGRRMTAG